MHGGELDLVVATVVELRHLCECELVLADLAALFCLLRKKNITHNHFGLHAEKTSTAATSEPMALLSDQDRWLDAH